MAICRTFSEFIVTEKSSDFKTLFCRLLCDTVINFQSNQEEVSLIVSPEKITFKNYVDDEPGNSFFYFFIFFLLRARKFEPTMREKMNRFFAEKSCLCDKCLYAIAEYSVLSV